jgi:transposase InsO family protein
LQRRCPEIHHWDQGVPCAAQGYLGVLEAAGVAVSMAETGMPIENAYAERFIRTLKDDEVYLHDNQDMDEARARICRFLDDMYMTRRIHPFLGYRTPAEFEAAYRGCQPAELDAGGGRGYGAPITDRQRGPAGRK